MWSTGQSTGHRTKEMKQRLRQSEEDGDGCLGDVLKIH